MRGAAGVNADAVGEGTLLALGLLTVIQGPRRAELVLLDDVELALHPAAQEQLVGVLRKLQKDDPELQIVATSHSPFILNFVDPAEVRITALGPDGAAVCEELVHHPQFDRWKDRASNRRAF
jgi:predicted ATPase